MCAFLPLNPICLFHNTNTNATPHPHPQLHHLRTSRRRHLQQPFPSRTPSRRGIPTLTLTPTRTTIVAAAAAPTTIRRLPLLTGLSAYLNSLPRNSTTLIVTLFTTSGCPQCTSVSRRLSHLFRTSYYNNHTNSSNNKTIRFYEVDLAQRENMQVGKRLGVKWVPLIQCYVWKDGRGNGEGGEGVGVVDERLVRAGESMDWLEERIAWFLNGGFVSEDWLLGRGN